MIKIDFEKLDNFVKDGLIKKIQNPFYPELFLYNYTADAQFSNTWDEEIQISRGLILNGQTNKIVAIPIKKFFNYDQEPGKSEFLQKLELNNEKYIIEEKLDGSYIQMFYHKDKWLVNTRGSWDNEQISKFSEIFKKHTYFELNSKEMCDSNIFYKDYNYIFEIIYPANRIVVDYKQEEKLVLLTAINKYNSAELQELNDLSLMFPRPLNFSNKYNSFSDLEKDIKRFDYVNLEGYIIKFLSEEEDNGNNFRVKIKYSEYCKLHKSISNLSNVYVYDFWKENKLNDLIGNMPDETYSFINKWISILTDNYEKINSEFDICKYKVCKFLSNITSLNEKEKRKEFAKWVFTDEHSSYLNSLLFLWYDGRDYKQEMLELVKPKEKEFCKFL
jgi:RNA ligase